MLAIILKQELSWVTYFFRYPARYFSNPIIRNGFRAYTILSDCRYVRRLPLDCRFSVVRIRTVQRSHLFHWRTFSWSYIHNRVCVLQCAPPNNCFEICFSSFSALFSATFLGCGKLSHYSGAHRRWLMFVLCWKIPVHLTCAACTCKMC